MMEDQEGFLYPEVNAEICIDCGLCERVCPEMNQNEPVNPSLAFAAKAQDDTIRKSSSSGGIFSLLAESVIDKGGVVFGSALNERWEAEHIFVDDKKSLVRLRGSKYMQSVVGNTFSQAKDFLEKGRQVLYSGTPCQVAGLKKYLGRDYDNLLTVDVICHGVPSPKVWRLYLDELLRTKCGAGKNTVQSLDEIPGIQDISFRDKTDGWKKFGFSIRIADFKSAKNSVSQSVEEFRESFTENAFFRLFLENVILRPSCYDCPAKSGKSGSDITLGDFWGIEKLMPEFDDDGGCSLVLINSDKGKAYFPKKDVHYRQMNPSLPLNYNSSYFYSSRKPKYRAYLFRKIIKTRKLDSKSIIVFGNNICFKIVRRVMKLFHS